MLPTWAIFQNGTTKEESWNKFYLPLLRDLLWGFLYLVFNLP